MKTLFSEPFFTVGVLFLVTIVSTISLLFYRFIFPKRKIHPVLLFFVISLLPVVSLFRSGTFEAGDLRVHTNLLTSFYQNLQDGIFLPFWAGGTCGGYGCPTFGIEYVLPFYLGSFFHMFGFSFLTSIKLVLAGSFIASGAAIYYFAKEEIGETAAFAAAIFYLFAPYHLVDIHFRGSIGEVLSFVFIPLVFLFAKKLIETNFLRFFFLESIVIVLLLMSHSSTTMVVAPLSFLYGIVVWMRKKNKGYRDLLLLGGSFLYAVAISAWYWLPAVTEVKYTWQSLYTFGLFPNPLYYFFSPVGGGLLFQGNKAQIYPVIGYIHIFLLLIGIGILIRNKFNLLSRLLFLFFFGSFLMLFFMLLPLSKPIWQIVPILHTFILIERLLVPMAFITSMLAGIVIKKIRYKKLIVVICFVAIISTLPNWANRKMVPASQAPISDEHEFYTEYFEPGNSFYLERYTTRLPMKEYIVTHPPLAPLEFISGSGEFVQTARTQERHQYVIHAATDSVIKENTLYFPGWIVLANNHAVPIMYTNKAKNSFGLITFTLPKGVYLVNVTFIDTPIRRIAKIFSAFPIVVGGLYPLFTQKRITAQLVNKRRKKS